MTTDYWSRARYAAGELVSEVTNRDWRVPPRPWSEFGERFTIPKFENLKNVSNRVSLNINYFQTNYLIILAIAFVGFLVRNPWSVFEVVLIVTGWVFATSARPMVIRGRRRITRKEKFGVMGCFTLLLPLCTGILLSLIYYWACAAFIAVLHAVFRHASVRHKAVDLRPPVNDKW